MAKQEHLSKLIEAARAWNCWSKVASDGILPAPSPIETWNHWRKDHSTITPQLYKAELNGADLSGADLNGADLRRAKLRGAELVRADLRGANLMWANLRMANLRAADLTGANLSEAQLVGANLNGADLRRASLHNAEVAGTIFADVNLSEAEHLDSVIHVGPSTIGIDTIYKSMGKIPDTFLRRAGVPNTFMAYIGSLLGVPIEFYSCFITYSRKDQEFTARLHADLQAKNLRVWFAPEDLKIGDRFQERIEESIRLYDKVMIVLSDESVKSRWVEREVNAAREREDREQRTVLFPIRIDDAVMEAPQPWAADIRRARHIGDFRRWKDHDSYQKALDRLLRDLRAEAAPPSRL